MQVATRSNVTEMSFTDPMVVNDIDNEEYEFIRYNSDEERQQVLNINKCYKSDGYTSLMRAVYANDLAKVQRLLKIQGIDVNVYSSQRYLGYPGSKRLYDVTALGIATMLGYTDITNELLKVRGIKSKKLYRKNSCSAFYKKYLTKSPKIKHLKLHKIMLVTLGIIQSDEDIEPEEETASETEPEEEDSDSEQEEEDGPVNKYDKKGHTPLMRAVYKRDLSRVKQLVNTPGIDLNAFSSNLHHGHYAAKYMSQETALGIATSRGYTEIVDMLLRTPGIISTKLDYID
jgi:ankyrin repeat protein